VTTNAILVNVDAIKVATAEFPKFANVGAPYWRTVFPKLLQNIDGLERGSGKKTPVHIHRLQGVCMAPAVVVLQRGLRNAECRRPEDRNCEVVRATWPISSASQR
jgi:hypothetical protein